MATSPNFSKSQEIRHWKKFLLKTARTSLRILSRRREINKLAILSRPGADFSLEKFFFMVMMSSVRKKGLDMKG